MTDEGEVNPVNDGVLKTRKSFITSPDGVFLILE